MDSCPAESSSADDLNKASVESWSTNAEFWDEYMGKEGNDFYQILEAPALETLVSLQEGEFALDLATGNGLVARRMAALGGIVTATDVSDAMLDRARARTSAEQAIKITYCLLDVTKPKDFERLISRAEEVYMTCNPCFPI
jgi:2-polyprenyl-3-methyl-5-hydroxy-6-metoxy-1,4-benzoquinol methylase